MYEQFCDINKTIETMIMRHIPTVISWKFYQFLCDTTMKALQLARFNVKIENSTR